MLAMAVVWGSFCLVVVFAWTVWHLRNAKTWGERFGILVLAALGVLIAGAALSPNSSEQPDDEAGRPFCDRGRDALC